VKQAVCLTALVPGLTPAAAASLNPVDRPLSAVAKTLDRLCDLCYYYNEFVRFHVLLPANSDIGETHPLEGGHVLEPLAVGKIFRQVAVYDVVSMYPSILIEFGLDLTSLATWRASNSDIKVVAHDDDDEGAFGSHVAEPCSQYTRAEFLDSSISSFVPLVQLVRRLLAARQDALFASMGSSTPTLLKLFANGMIGNFGNVKSAYYCPTLNRIITWHGRRLIRSLFPLIANDAQHVGIYGDSDSCFICLKPKPKANKGGVQMEEVDSPADVRLHAEQFLKTLNTKLSSPEADGGLGFTGNCVRFKLECVFDTLFFASKKRYCGLTATHRSDDSFQLIVKGLESVRRDMPTIYRKQLDDFFQKFLMLCRSTGDVLPDLPTVIAPLLLDCFPQGSASTACDEWAVNRVAKAAVAAAGVDRENVVFALVGDDLKPTTVTLPYSSADPCVLDIQRYEQKLLVPALLHFLTLLYPDERPFSDGCRGVSCLRERFPWVQQQCATKRSALEVGGVVDGDRAAKRPRHYLFEEAKEDAPPTYEEDLDRIYRPLLEYWRVGSLFDVSLDDCVDRVRMRVLTRGQGCFPSSYQKKHQYHCALCRECAIDGGHNLLDEDSLTLVCPRCGATESLISGPFPEHPLEVQGLLTLLLYRIEQRALQNPHKTSCRDDERWMKAETLRRRVNDCEPMQVDLTRLFSYCNQDTN
jgi:hypothetical protein